MIVPPLGTGILTGMGHTVKPWLLTLSRNKRQKAKV
jgi:hypothetical protein